MEKQDNRGRPRDPVYETVAADILAHVKRYPDIAERGWGYDISSPLQSYDTTADRRARFLGFRQSTVFKETVRKLLEQGYVLKMHFEGNSDCSAVIRIIKGR